MSIRKRLPGLSIAFLIGIAAALPLLFGLPKGIDTLFHLYRLVQVDALMQDGIFFSRWSPDLVFGYGYPLFNYYAPLSYYIAKLVHLVPGITLTTAFIATYALALIAASIFMYLWVRDLFGETASLTAAAIYVLSPYIMSVAYIRGALAEQVALALLPLILLAFRRLIVTNSRFYAAIGTLAFAGLIVTHNITALMFTPLLLIYILVVVYSKSGDEFSWTRLINGATGRAYWLILLGLGLAAFYWLPALFERDLVQFSQAFGPQVFNYTENFLKLNDLLALPFRADIELVNPQIPITLSLIAIILGVFGLAGTIRFRGQVDKNAHLWFALIMSLVSLLMTISLSKPVWELLPVLQTAQFPWRFLGVAGLYMAYVAGVGLENLVYLLAKRLGNEGILIWGISALLTGAVVIYIIPWQIVNYHPTGQPSIDESQQYERDSGYIGTTSTGEYLPVFVQELPSENKRNLNGLERLQPESIPDEGRVISAEYDPLDYELEIASPETFTAVFDTFFFEGWMAEIDGQPAEISPTSPFGLISVQMPAGQHRLAISFQSTMIRNLANLISWASLVLFIASLILLFPRKLAEVTLVSTNNGSMPSEYYVLVGGTLLVIIILGAVYLNEPGGIFRQQRFEGQRLAGLDIYLDANFDNQMILMGLDGPASIVSGEAADIALYWRTPAEVDQEYSVSVTIVNHNGNVIAQHDNQHPGQIPTDVWSPIQYARDVHHLKVPLGTPPGTYEVLVSAYHYGQPEERLNILDENMAPAGQSISISTLDIDRPLNPPSVAGFIESESQVRRPVDKNIELIDVTLLTRTINVGENALLGLSWLATGDPERDVMVKIGLKDVNGVLLQANDIPLIVGYPTTQWERGDYWLAEHQFLLDPQLSTGEYIISMETEIGNSYDLAVLDVVAPIRDMVPPPMEYSSGTTFNSIGSLAGFSIPGAVQVGTTVPITLTWRSLGETTISYKSFVQLLDEERMVVGSDMIPGNWRRPTTSWIADEFITETHELQIPQDIEPGTYQILVGLYDPLTMERLQTDQNGEGLLLSEEIRLLPR